MCRGSRSCKKGSFGRTFIRGLFRFLAPSGSDYILPPPRIKETTWTLKTETRRTNPEDFGSKDSEMLRSVNIRFEGPRADQNARDPDFLPKYQTVQSAGMDLRADLSSPIKILPGERATIGTGLSFVIGDPQTVALIVPRSGLGSKGLTLANTVGVIDSDYSGEVKLFFVNTGLNPIVVSPKDRVAQLLFMPVERVAWKIVSDHEPTERGTGGFGSTGRD